MKINDNKQTKAARDVSEKRADRKDGEKKSDGPSFKELLKKGEEGGRHREVAEKKGRSEARKAMPEAAGELESKDARKASSNALDAGKREKMTLGEGDGLRRPAKEKYMHSESRAGSTAAGHDRAFEDAELSPDDRRALMQGGIPGVAPPTEGQDVAQVKQAQPLAPSQSRHEVTEKILATIVSEGYVTEDVKGRKVVMMQVDVPGRGTVNMRLWRRSSGVELRMRADDPQLASEIRRNRGRLEAGARDRGIHFSKVEVVG